MDGDAQSTERLAEPPRLFANPWQQVAPVVRAMRPYQWVKNLLVFAPLFLAQTWLDVDKLTAGLLAFVAFSLCASAVYVFNDMMDIEADRHHPNKRLRPFASGALPLAWGPPLALVCIAAAFSIGGLCLGRSFLALLLGYFLLTSAYSIWLKRIVILDVLVLSGLYILRILAGGAATETLVSEWLMGFALFFFNSLAFAKRYSELTRLQNEHGQAAEGRGYRVEDWSLLESIGPTNGYLAVLVFANYIHSEKSAQFYPNPWALWLVCPILLYWVSRIWIKAKRQELLEDPVLFAVKDPVSLLLAALLALLVAYAGMG